MGKVLPPSASPGREGSVGRVSQTGWPNFLPIQCIFLSPSSWIEGVNLPTCSGISFALSLIKRRCQVKTNRAPDAQLTTHSQEHHRLGAEEKGGKIMQCPRCHGLMVVEQYDDQLSTSGEAFTGARCLMCGNIMDAVIARHRHARPDVIHVRVWRREPRHAAA
jgi:hypothetical protein